MRKTLLAAIALCSLTAMAEKNYPELPLKLTDETEAQKAERLAWWQHDRFGLFVHFGLYAVPARHEWVQRNERIDPKTYESRYMPRFNPDLFDARDWARRAKAAGMKYAVLTTKHHEGFCMWDTKTTDYKLPNTAFKRDLVREFVDAFRAEGLKVGFYYSIIDWHHPDFLIDQVHPLCPDNWKELPDEKAAELNKGRDMARYRAYMFAQVKELLTQYGKIDIVWYDFTMADKEHPAWQKTYKDYDAVNLLKLTRRLQPGVIIDNRLDLMDTDDGWDFVTPEQYKVAKAPEVRGKPVAWETCQTFSGSWGYYRDEATWKSVPQLIELLSETVSKGGNLILNVGPTARGEWDARARARLDGMAEWMRRNSRAIYGCTAAPEGLTAPNGTVVTWNPELNRAYIHLCNYPMGFLPVAWADKIEYAQFLHDGSELPVKGGGVQLPMLKPDVEIPVIELWLKTGDGQ